MTYPLAICLTVIGTIVLILLIFGFSLWLVDRTDRKRYSKGTRFNPFKRGEWSGHSMDHLHCRVMSLFPGAYLGEDNDGQIVIYTDLHDHEGTVEDFVSSP